MFHLFEENIEHITLPTQFTCPFYYKPHELCKIASRQVIKHIENNANILHYSQQGKMFGVLIVQNQQNEIGFIAAFSGQLAGTNKHDYFIPPVFDILEDRKFFIEDDETITQINKEIETIENSNTYIQLQKNIASFTIEKEQTLIAAKQQLQQAKQQRDEIRKVETNEDILASLITESQFQKAEYKRLEHTLENKSKILQDELSVINANILQLKQKRKELSATLQKKLFSRFYFLNALGTTKSLFEIFETSRHTLPPAGAGECAGPRLLQYAYKQHLKPLAMAEFWYGQSPKQEIRVQGNFYPSCKHKCEPILQFMLQGLDVEDNPLEKKTIKTLDIIYEDAYLIAINKPSGMLSVPGKTHTKSALEILTEQQNINIYPIHRLDLETSGILLFAKTLHSQKCMQELFAKHSVSKQYIAILQETISQDSGIIKLPLRSDYEHRPMQVVDFEKGKYAETEYKVLQKNNTNTRIAFFPKTGRTHQLRVHSAHPLGLNCPIVGDNLYGQVAERLFLHAESITFTHPETGKIVSIHCQAPF